MTMHCCYPWTSTWCTSVMWSMLGESPSSWRSLRKHSRPGVCVCVCGCVGEWVGGVWVWVCVHGCVWCVCMDVVQFSRVCYKITTDSPFTKHLLTLLRTHILTHPHTLTHTHTVTHTLMHTHTVTHCWALKHISTHTVTHTHTVLHCHTLTHIGTHSLSHTDTHSHTHWHTHSHSHTCTAPHTQCLQPQPCLHSLPAKPYPDAINALCCGPPGPGHHLSLLLPARRHRHRNLALHQEVSGGA